MDFLPIREDLRLDFKNMSAKDNSRSDDTNIWLRSSGALTERTDIRIKAIDLQLDIRGQVARTSGLSQVASRLLDQHVEQTIDRLQHQLKQERLRSAGLEQELEVLGRRLQDQTSELGLICSEIQHLESSHRALELSLIHI